LETAATAIADGLVARAASDEAAAPASRNGTAAGQSAARHNVRLQAAELAVGLLELVLIAFCIPFVILAVGVPIALGVRLLLWGAGML
jgi:hypothetical protein